MTRSGPADQGQRLWTLPVRARRVLAAAEPMRALRNGEAPEDFSALAIQDIGYVLAFRFGRGVYLGWLGEDLRAVRELAEVPLPGADAAGLALATNGRRLLLVVAVRGAGSTDGGVTGSPYELHAAVFGTLESPVQLRRLATALTGREHELEPSAAALPDGGWLVAWTRGAQQTHTGSRDTQRVLLGRFGTDLAPLGAPLPLNVEESASRPALLVSGERFVAALLQGRGHVRSVVTRTGRCTR